MEGKTSLRGSLLLLGHPVVRVHQHDSLAIGLESEGCLVASNALVRKGLEDLLKGGLCHTVLFNTESLLVDLKLTEEPADRLVLLGYSELEELSALLKDFDAFEMSRQVGEDGESVGLISQEFK